MSQKSQGYNVIGRVSELITACVPVQEHTLKIIFRCLQLRQVTTVRLCNQCLQTPFPMPTLQLLRQVTTVKLSNQCLQTPFPMPTLQLRQVTTVKLSNQCLQTPFPIPTPKQTCTPMTLPYLQGNFNIPVSRVVCVAHSILDAPDAVLAATQQL